MSEHKTEEPYKIDCGLYRFATQEHKEAFESLKQQRDDLLVACKRTLGAMTCDELNNGQVFDDDLRKEVKEQAYAAIAKCEA